MSEVNTINTSLKQVPAAFKKFADEIDQAELVLNYGAGKYPELVDHFLCREIEHYEPNYSGNYAGYYSVMTERDQLGHYGLTICANVLNVIEDNVDLEIAITDCIVSSSKTIWQIYEGDRYSIGRATTKGYQRNNRTSFYYDLIRQHCANVRYSGNYIIRGF